MTRRPLLLLAAVLFYVSSFAQKKSLDHTVYDNWQSIGEKLISNDGKWVVYTIDPQEGDNQLVIQSPVSNYKKTIPRGYRALITEDSRFVIFKIKPFFRETREAKIKKKRPADMPKDSIGILELGKENIWKLAKAGDFKTPAKGFGWVAYQVEKKPESPAKVERADVKKITDSLNRIIDSLQEIITAVSKQPASKNDKRKKDEEGFEELDYYYDADGDDSASVQTNTATDLILRDLNTGDEKIFPGVSDFYFSKNGRNILLKQASSHPVNKVLILLYDLQKGSADTISSGGNIYKNFTISEDGSQVAFIAEQYPASKLKGQPKNYRLWYYKDGMDTAVMVADKNSPGMQLGMTVSEFSNPEFSKSGKRLFFGTCLNPVADDTTLVEMDKVKLDIWHYNDPELQTVQLHDLRTELQRNYLAFYDLETNTVRQLASREIPLVYRTNEGDGDLFVGVTDFGKRISIQWTSNTAKDIYAISAKDGSNTLIKKDFFGNLNASYLSPSGKYVMWYDSKAKNYFAWDGRTTRNITEKIKVSLADENHDSPSDPPPYGVMGWREGDSLVYIYDRYDVWIVDPDGKTAPRLLPPFSGRKDKWARRYVRTDPEERAINQKSGLLFNIFDEKDKTRSLWFNNGYLDDALTVVPEFKKTSFAAITKAKNADAFIYTAESYNASPDLYFSDSKGGLGKLGVKLSSINEGQNDYNWGTAELFTWKAYDGKEAQGIVYKPEDFDPKKKYPMICYFYETLSNGLYTYIPPAPSPSRLNISFFVSRGYIVFTPDIHYGTGHPGRDAYNYVVSGTRALVKKGFVDSTRLGLQGQSWGGYQVAYIITMTNLYKAAWAGAPVANMTSAYGGVRWESGKSRQFQYEKDQSRLGATLWEKPELYIENSPLFHLPKVKTPLVIMSNDNDGAVPWYQGIEFFTAMRRLNKKIWMLSYNGEAHNLVERKNRKDISIREQQFFDWLLKDERPARWITEGVPAVKKGKDWGLETD